MGKLGALAMAVCVSLAGCQREQLTAPQAKGKADEYARAEHSLDDLTKFDATMRESREKWYVTYTPRGEAAGRPVTVEVEKSSGKAATVQ